MLFQQTSTRMNKNWRVEAQPHNHFEYSFSAMSSHTFEGWLRISAAAKNKAAIEYLQQQLPLFLRQNDNLQRVTFVDKRSNQMVLVFYRHSPLLQFHLSVLPNIPSDAVFDIKIQRISASRAWLSMLQAVATTQAQQGIPKSHIYRITRARQKRGGKAKALEKLVQTYQPLLGQQLINCEPYQWWRLHKEGPLLDSLIEQAHQGKTYPVCCHPLHQPLPQAINANSWYLFTQNDIQYSPVLKHVLEHHTGDLVYWDHDETNNKGERIRPAFKPQWDPNLLARTHYIGHAFAIRGHLIETLKLKTFTSHAQLLSCALAPTLQQRSLSVTHIPAVLSHIPHTEKHETPTLNTAVTFAKSLYGAQANILRVEPHAFFPGVLNIEATPVSTPKVSIIIPTRDALHITRNCVESVLHKTTYQHYEIVLIDNQSEQRETLEWLNEIAQDSRVRVLKYPYPFNYSAINNFAVTHANGEYICLLNNDTEVISTNWLTAMLAEAVRPKTGCVGAKLYYFDNTVQHAGVILGIWGLAGHAHKFYTRYDAGYLNRLICTHNFSAVTAACLLVKKEIYQQVGGLNETQLTVAFNDVDFCLKVKQAGYQNIWCANAELYHYESKTRGKDNTPERRKREQAEIAYMQAHWYSEINNDPCYSPHLTRVREDFSIQIEP